MPAKSAKQEKFMQAVAHSPKFAKKVGVPQSVGKEFTTKGAGMKQAKEMPMGKGAKKMANGGFTSSADGVAVKGKTKAKQITMAKGGAAKAKKGCK